MFGSRVIPLSDRQLTRPNRRVAEAGFLEAGRCWSDLVAMHVASRTKAAPEIPKWLTKGELEAATKGGIYALHSQTVQALCGQLMDNVATTRTLRAKGDRKMRYPYKPKERMTLEWTNQGGRYDASARRLVLPMGRKTASIVIKRIDLSPEELESGLKLVWHDGAIELHVGAAQPDKVAAGQGRATVDLGEIHQATVVASDGAAMVMSGRGVRTLKRKHCQRLADISAKRKRRTKGSKRDLRLEAVRRKATVRFDRRVSHLRNCGIKAVIGFCVEHGAKEIWVGDPDGVRDKNCGRKHNRRMALWEYGEDLRLLEDKALRAGMAFGKGDERGTSSKCPQCGSRHKPKGRQWRCPKCSFQGHRDVVGAFNMHSKAYPGTPVPDFPREVTYLRPGPIQKRGNEYPPTVRTGGTDSSSSADTRLREAQRSGRPTAVARGESRALESGHTDHRGRASGSSSSKVKTRNP